MKTTLTTLLLILSISIKAQTNTNYIRAEVEYQQGKSLLIGGMSLGLISVTPLLMDNRMDFNHKLIIYPTLTFSFTLQSLGVWHLVKGRMILNRRK